MSPALLLVLLQGIAIRAETVHTGTGESFAPGMVLVRDGKIEEVRADDRLPGGYRRVEGIALTPGLVDANASVGLAQRGAEESSEIHPHLRVVDNLDPLDRRFERLARLGVTTVYLSPSPRAVFGGLGAVVKTTGASVEGRILVAQSSTKLAMGSEPSSGNIPVRFGTPFSFFFRRPTTRMGVVWLVRKAFFDAEAYRKTWRDYRTGGNTSSVEGGPPEGARAPGFDPALEVLLEVQEGKRALRVTARHATDIRTALRLAQEFGLAIQIDEAPEAWRCVDELAATRTPVIVGPIERPSLLSGGRRDADEPRLGNAALVARAGVPLALTASERALDEPLPQQAAFAIRFGLPLEEAIRAVTSTPASLLGVAERVGSVEKGKDADLVLWSGAPFAATSRPVFVLVDGRIVLDETAPPPPRDG